MAAAVGAGAGVGEVAVGAAELDGRAVEGGVGTGVEGVPWAERRLGWGLPARQRASRRLEDQPSLTLQPAAACLEEAR